MALALGTRLGPYEIVAALGAGGMGEVYRARDTKLNRDVAIKILPDAFASDPERLARFTREAHMLAALNHPNIAGIYGLEESGGVRALVMELVEGEDLSQRIARGKIPLDEALPIAKQIADALEAAHEQGIVHRDLKPANIKVKADGAVKVLDFGLAKGLEPAAGAVAGEPGAMASASMSPTITTPALMTGAGMILGTAAYMSPEQARGRTVDRRADVWAFGCVLFEMLTGRRAFPGDDVTDTLAAVVRSEPDWTAIPSEVPPVLGMFLRRCLQKDPRQRVGDIHDVRLALEGGFESHERPAHPVVVVSRLPWIWIAACAILGIAAALLAVPAGRHLRETPASASPATLVDLVTPPTDRPDSFALSSDGRQLAFVATESGVSRLWLRSLGSAASAPIAGTEGASRPFWAPDGRSIGFFATAALKRVDVQSGALQTLASVASGQGGTWNANGVIVFSASTTQGLMRIDASGGTATALAVSIPGQEGHVRPTFLPDGRHLLFVATGGPNVAGLYLSGLDEHTAERVTALPSGTTSSAAYTFLSPDWLVWRRGSVLVAQHLDIEKGMLTGQPATVANGVASVSSAGAGLIAYRSTAGQLRRLTWLDRSGAERGTAGEADASLDNPAISADGRHIAVSRTSSDGANQDLWIIDGDHATRFTFDPAAERFPVWSPDGARVVFYSTRNGPGDLFVKLANASGPEGQIPAPEQFKLPTSWSADGRYLLFQRTDPQTSSDLWVLSMATDHPTASVFLKTPAAERFGAFSPDGRWVAYQSNESGRNEIYVRPFVPPGAGAGLAAVWQVSTGGGIMPVWAHNGKELFFLNPVGGMMSASIAVNGSTFVPGAPVQLFETRIVGGGTDNQQGREYDVAPDGRFLINRMLDQATPPITLLQNWSPPTP